MADIHSTWGARGKVAETGGADLPVHIKNVHKVSLSNRIALLRQFPSLKHLADKFEVAAGLFSHIPTSVVEDANMSREDIEALLHADLIRMAPDQNVTTNTRSFCVPEIAKGRRRWICHPPNFNTEASQRMESVSLPKPDEVMNKVGRFRFAWDIDLRSYYHQFGLDDYLFVFRCHNKLYHLTTIPTGAAPCPLLAQYYSTALAQLAKEQVPEDDVDFDVYIDNIRLLTNDEGVLRRFMRALFRSASVLQIEINESSEEVFARDMQKYEFLGIAFDHGNQSTKLGTKTRNKLIDITNEGTNPTMGAVLRWFGVLQYAAFVNGTVRGKFFWIYKFMRRRAQQRSLLKEPANIWPSLANQWCEWLRIELEAPARIWDANKQPTAPVTIYTDASGSGYAAVIFLHDRTLTCAGRWPVSWRSRHINVKEAFALWAGLKRCGQIFRLDSDYSNTKCEGLAVDIRVDNTSVLYCAKKGLSRSWELNCIVTRIRRLPVWQYVRSCEYVSSMDNRADKASRIWEGTANDAVYTLAESLRCSFEMWWAIHTSSGTREAIGQHAVILDPDVHKHNNCQPLRQQGDLGSSCLQTKEALGPLSSL